MEKISDKLFSWASILEPKTREQARMTSTMKFIYPHLALMPDAHLGKGATVGSVIPTVGAIMPAAVGVDIGCGMIAVQTQFTVDDLRTRGNLPLLRLSIEDAIPSSAGRYNQHLTKTAINRIEDLENTPGIDTANQLAPNWDYQLGSLGSGNHFIEVTADESDNVWLFLHSGSRGVGNKIAQNYIKIAQELRVGMALPDRDLAWLDESTYEFDSYIRDLRWAQKFALLNREEMMGRVIKCVSSFMDAPVKEQRRINCHHNFTQQEHHFGKDVWLSRKGAIEAKAGQWGLIPGSMGTASYVVQGLGNEMSMNSSPHGAGRVYSRSAAKREFTLGELEASMQGIEWSGSAAFLDEIPAAYKDIDQVMLDAADLVEIKYELHQIINVKGV